MEKCVAEYNKFTLKYDPKNMTEKLEAGIPKLDTSELLYIEVGQASVDSPAQEMKESTNDEDVQNLSDIIVKLDASGRLAPTFNSTAPSDSDAAKICNDIATANVGSDKHQRRCFNFSISPGKLMSVIIPKSMKSSCRPICSSQCRSEVTTCEVWSPELSPIGSDGINKLFQLSFLGMYIPRKFRIDRIDYSKLSEEKVIPAFLSTHPCYDVMPTSGKVIILSVELLVKNAFSALVTNDIKAAPLWDSGLFDFVGMLTISDFINVLRHYHYSSPDDIKDIENQSISTWRRITKVTKPFTKVNGLDSLAQATKILIKEGVHRVPVFDEKRQCVLFVLTRKRLLHFLSYSLFEKFEKTNVKTPSFFRKKLSELQIGTFENIATIKMDSKVIEALDIFAQRKVSALPVVDEKGELKDIFEKFDVFALAKEQTYHNLDMTVIEAIQKASESMKHESACPCSLDDTLGTVIDRFVTFKVHRLVITNDKYRVVGIISLSDLLKFLVVQPLESMEESGGMVGPSIIEEAEGAVGGSDISVFLDSEQESFKTPVAEDPDKADLSISENLSNLKIQEDMENGCLASGCNVPKESQ